MKMRALPPLSTLRSWLRYDQRSGNFIWLREPRANRPLIGAIAGSRRKSGYVAIKIRGYGLYHAHRIAWVMTFGHLAEDIEVDHRDGDPTNNTISNLRLATSSQQKRNKRVQSNNRCGLKGAYYHACHKGKKWRSQIKVNDKLIFLGYFHSAEEAHRAYADAAAIHFGEFAKAA